MFLIGVKSVFDFDNQAAPCQVIQMALHSRWLCREMVVQVRDWVGGGWRSVGAGLVFEAVDGKAIEKQDPWCAGAGFGGWRTVF